jgi:hypothetical protein
MAPAQAKGHAYTIAKAAQHLREGATEMKLGESYNVGGKLLHPDEAYKVGSWTYFREFKNYNGAVSLTDFNKIQMEKYAELLGTQPVGNVEYWLKNGAATSRFLEKARELNAAYGRTVIKIFAESGTQLV